MNRKRRYKRGYPVAILVGFEEDHVVLWQVFSRVVKLFQRLELEGQRRDNKDLYNFHESVVEALKPALKEGIRSIVVTAPAKTTYTQGFLEHIKQHHSYLVRSKNANRANFAELIGSAEDRIKVADLINTKEFTESIAQTTSEEADQIVANLEKHLYNDNNSIILYSLNEIENMVYSRKKDKTHRNYLLLTDKFLAYSKQKNRIHRLLQISKNKKIKTRVIDAETSAGTRIQQFGGIVFFAILVNHDANC
jgi:stalled ribosome rescue protein Dom34